MHKINQGSRTAPPNERRLTRIERLSFLDGAFYCSMVGCGETYIVAFALALGFSPQSAGLTSILPLVAGALLQPFSNRFMRRRRGARGWSVACSILQSLALCALGGGSFLLRNHPHILLPYFFAVTTWYWSVALSISPLWNIWIGRLIPAARHLDFFVRRTRMLQVATLVSMVGAGYFLSHMTGKGGNLGAFALLFMLAAAFRLLSVCCLWFHPDIALEQPASGTTSSPTDLAWLKVHPAAMMLAFTFLINMAVYFSSPYFTPFMLRDLKLDYGIYAVLTSLSFIARVATAGVMARIGGRFGVRALLMLGTIGIVPVAWMWTISTSLAYLVFVQFVTGFVWGCHELGLTLYLMESVADKWRIKLLSFMQMTTALGMLAGSMLGALFAVGKALDTATYYDIFTISSLLRALPALVLLLWTPRIIALLGGFFGPSRHGAKGRVAASAMAEPSHGILALKVLPRRFAPETKVTSLQALAAFPPMRAAAHGSKPLPPPDTLPVAK